MEEMLYILWGEGEWDAWDKSLEEAIAHVKFAERYQNLGHKGALIVRGTPLYEIKVGPIERTFFR